MHPIWDRLVVFSSFFWENRWKMHPNLVLFGCFLKINLKKNIFSNQPTQIFRIQIFHLRATKHFFLSFFLFFFFDLCKVHYCEVDNTCTIVTCRVDFMSDVFEVQCIANMLNDWYHRTKPNLDTDSQTGAFDVEPQTKPGSIIWLC